jgi:hypothetical protein
VTLEQNIESFSELGNILRNILDGKESRYGKRFQAIIENHYKTNPWFTPDNIRMAIKSIAYKLTYDNLKIWTDRYPAISIEHKPLRVGVIMAGNIPLVGFHDFLTVLISGNNLLAKTSSKDSELISAIADILFSIHEEFRNRIEFANGQLKDFDLVIATGSDNSSRYFEYYFGRYPHIIRKNRNSVAIIEGDESDTDFRNLGTDIFSYFGLGCRNVSKIYLPAGFDLHRMIKNWNEFSGIVNHNRYANNYEYNMAVYMVNREKFVDTGFLLLRENRTLSSPVAVLHYQYYASLKDVSFDIESQPEKIQCIVSKKEIPFGIAQYPELWDFADNIDTLDFLLKKKMSGIM